MNSIQNVLSYSQGTLRYTLDALLEAAAGVHADPSGRRAPTSGVATFAMLMGVAMFHPRSMTFGVVTSVACAGRMSDPCVRIGVDAVSPVLLCSEWVVIDQGAVSAVADYLDSLYTPQDTATAVKAVGTGTERTAAGRRARSRRR